MSACEETPKEHAAGTATAFRSRVNSSSSSVNPGGSLELMLHL